MLLRGAAYCGSSRSRWPYSFTFEPQPAALVTMVSTSGAFEGVDRAARQHDGRGFFAGVHQERAAAGLIGGATTSQPSAASTRTVAAFTCGKNSRWTQPSSRPTRRRFVPCAGVTLGDRFARRGVGASALPSRADCFGSRFRMPLRAQQRLHAGFLIGEQRKRSIRSRSGLVNMLKMNRR